jgi:hypothetical protein
MFRNTSGLFTRKRKRSDVIADEREISTRYTPLFGPPPVGSPPASKKGSFHININDDIYDDTSDSGWSSPDMGIRSLIPDAGLC